jgi:hypothetical protein
MKKPRPKESKGGPWADQNETESSPPDTRPEEYGDANPYQAQGDKTPEPRPAAPEREIPDDRVEREQDR